MLQLLNLSAWRKKRKSYPHLLYVANKQKSPATPRNQSRNADYRVHSGTSVDMVRHGKSNKFDCTNRRNEGVDLGKSIGDAALKELEKTKKDATRQAG